MYMMNEQMVLDNMKLVYHVVNRYYPHWSNDEDIIQCGMVGLCKAVETWDESKSKFSTFACACIRNEINNEFRKIKKHKGILSLDAMVAENTSFADFLIGDDDVIYVDVNGFYDKLTPRQRKICGLVSMGLTQMAIAERLGVSQTLIWTEYKKIKLIWSEINGN